MLIKCAAAIILVCALIAHATDLDIEHKDETIGSATILVSTDPVPGPEPSHRGATDSEDDSKPTSVLEPTEQLGEEISQEEVINPKGEWYLDETKEDATNLNQKDVPQEDTLGDGDGAALGDGDGAGFWRRRRRRRRRSERRRRSAANERRKRAATQTKINQAERKQIKKDEASMRKERPKLEKTVDKDLAAAVPITRFKCSSFLESPDKWIVRLGAKEAELGEEPLQSAYRWSASQRQWSCQTRQGKASDKSNGRWPACPPDHQASGIAHHSLGAKEEEKPTRTRTTLRTLLGSDRRRSPPKPAPKRREPTTFVLAMIAQGAANDESCLVTMIHSKTEVPIFKSASEPGESEDSEFASDPLERAIPQPAFKGSDQLGDSDDSSEVDSDAHRATSASEQKLSAGGKAGHGWRRRRRSGRRRKTSEKIKRTTSAAYIYVEYVKVSVCKSKRGVQAKRKGGQCSTKELKELKQKRKADKAGKAGLSKAKRELATKHKELKQKRKAHSELVTRMNSEMSGSSAPVKTQDTVNRTKIQDPSKEAARRLLGRRGVGRRRRVSAAQLNQAILPAKGIERAQKKMVKINTNVILKGQIGKYTKKHRRSFGTSGMSMKCTVKKVVIYSELRNRKKTELGEVITDSTTEPSNAHVGNPASRNLLGRGGTSQTKAIQKAADNEMARLEKNRIKTKRSEGIKYMKRHLPKPVQLCVLGKSNTHVHLKGPTTRSIVKALQRAAGRRRRGRRGRRLLGSGRRRRTRRSKKAAVFWRRRRRSPVARRRRTRKNKTAKIGFRDGRYCITVNPTVQKYGVVWKSSISNSETELGEGSGLGDTLTHQEKLHLAKDRVAQRDVDQCLNMQWEKREREMCVISKAFKIEADKLGAMVV